MPRIEIVPYDKRWPEEFATIAKALRETFGYIAVRIDHIGSTSVPGLAAKDVIDLQLTVREIDRELFAPHAAAAGFSVDPELRNDHVPPGESNDDPAEWTKAWLHPARPMRRNHVHVRQAGRANQRYPLLFRDYLRANPGAAESYRLIKVALARLHPDDMDAYYDVKDPVCDLIIDSAERWAKDTSWTLGPSDA